MAINIKPTSQIKARLGLNKNGEVQKFFTNTCYKAMDKYVPMDQGDLRKNSYVVQDLIIYESPYAHAQYVGYTKGPVKNYTTPGTGPYWDKRMWSAEGKKIIEQVQERIGR
jgi:hypothetical protein